MTRSNSPSRLAARAISFILLFSSGLACAQVTIADPWVRGTVGGMRATGAFMQISSKTDVKLVAAASPVARTVEVHEMAVVDNVMRMRAVASIPVTPGKPVMLEPGGYHVMLIGLEKPLAPGASVPITLTFEDRGGKRQQVQVNAEVRPLNAPAGDGAAAKAGSAGAHHMHSK
jgi:periplasmic copper chaperone A